MRLLESMENNVALEALIDETDPETWCNIHPISWSAFNNPDTMYLDKALSQRDQHEFIKAMQKELQDHSSNHHWKIIKRSEVPKGVKVLPTVWLMKRKICIDQESLQMEGPSEPIRKLPRVWHQLLEDLLPSGGMDNHQILSHCHDHFWVVKQATKFYPRLPPSRH